MILDNIAWRSLMLHFMTSPHVSIHMRTVEDNTIKHMTKHDIKVQHYIWTTWPHITLHDLTSHHIALYDITALHCSDLSRTYPRRKRADDRKTHSFATVDGISFASKNDALYAWTRPFHVDSSWIYEPPLPPNVNVEIKWLGRNLQNFFRSHDLPLATSIAFKFNLEIGGKGGPQNC